jgi:hypothetical protein
MTCPEPLPTDSKGASELVFCDSVLISRWRALRSHRGGQGFKSPQLHQEAAGQGIYLSAVASLQLFRCPILGSRWEPILMGGPRC